MTAAAWGWVDECCGDCDRSASALADPVVGGRELSLDEQLAAAAGEPAPAFAGDGADGEGASALAEEGHVWSVGTLRAARNTPIADNEGGL